MQLGEDASVDAQKLRLTLDARARQQLVRAVLDERCKRRARELQMKLQTEHRRPDGVGLMRAGLTRREQRGAVRKIEGFAVPLKDRIPACTFEHGTRAGALDVEPA